MMTEEEYKSELIRMWDSIREDEYYKGYDDCVGVTCKECPIYEVEYDSCPLHYDISSYSRTKITDEFDLYGIIEKWSKEHPNEDE